VLGRQIASPLGLPSRRPWPLSAGELQAALDSRVSCDLDVW